MGSNIAKLLIMLILLTTIANGMAYVDKPIKPHVNPKELPEEIGCLELMLLYINAFSALINMDFDNVSQTIMLLNITDVPQNLRYIFNRVNELLNTTNNEVKLAKEHLDNATILLAKNLYSEALSEANMSMFHAVKANISLIDLKDALNELLGKIPIPSLILDKVIKLKELLHELIKELFKLIAMILENVKEIQEFKPIGNIPTLIEVYVGPKKTLINSTVNVYGFLKALNNTGIYGLMNKTISIFIDGKLVKKTKTNNNGFFNETIHIPLLYKDYVIVSVSYIPTFSEARIYMPCYNETILYLEYFKTSVEIEVPSTIYPGIAFNVSISINPPNVRLFHLYVNGKCILADYTNINGTYNTMLMVNASSVLEVYVEPYGLYGPGYARKYVRVSYIPIEVKVDVPDVIYPPLGFEVKGIVLGNNTPLSYVNASIVIANSIYNTLTDVNGTFQLRIPSTPITLVGLTDLVIMVKPKEPWFMEKAVKFKVFALNLVLTSSVLAVFATSMAFAYIYLVSRKVEEITLPPRVVKEKPRKVPEIGLKITDVIVAEFVKLLNALGRLTGLVIKESETLREYLLRISTYLSRKLYMKVYRIFVMMEQHLYSPIKIKGRERVESFINMIRDVINEILKK